MLDRGLRGDALGGPGCRRATGGSTSSCVACAAPRRPARSTSTAVGGGAGPSRHARSAPRALSAAHGGGAAVRPRPEVARYEGFMFACSPAGLEGGALAQQGRPPTWRASSDEDETQLSCARCDGGVKRRGRAATCAHGTSSAAAWLDPRLGGRRRRARRREERPRSSAGGRRRARPVARARLGGARFGRPTCATTARARRLAETLETAVRSGQPAVRPPSRGPGSLAADARSCCATPSPCTRAAGRCTSRSCAASSPAATEPEPRALDRSCQERDRRLRSEDHPQSRGRDVRP